MQNLAHLTNLFRSLHVLVIGDAMLDSYLEGAAGALCREAPVPIVAVQRRVNAPGGDPAVGDRRRR
jgi:D-beta-D-heptose 7-phosphate kinase/D-beta-D-heptose 1-phosphate adenosyltransferase